MCPYRVNATQSSNESIPAIDIGSSQLDDACAPNHPLDDPITCSDYLERRFGKSFDHRAASRSSNAVRV